MQPRTNHHKPETSVRVYGIFGAELTIFVRLLSVFVYRSVSFHRRADTSLRCGQWIRINAVCAKWYLKSFATRATTAGTAAVASATIVQLTGMSFLCTRTCLSHTQTTDCCAHCRIRLPNDAVGKDSRVCENCHSKLSGRNPTSSLSKATSAVNPNIHGDGDAGGIGSSSESEAQPESLTTVVDIASAEHEPSSSSSTTAAQPPRANWRQSVMGAMDASSIMSAARGLKKRGKKKRHPRAPQASWIREQTEAEAKRRQGFDSGADSDSDSDSEGPPPAPARRRGSDTSTMTETSQRSRPASTAQPANAESPALSSDNDSDANARPLTLKRYGSVPITGVLDAATQRALQVFCAAC